MVEKLQELRNLRIQKLKKQGINAGFLLLTWIHTHTHTHIQRDFVLHGLDLRFVIQVLVMDRLLFCLSTHHSECRSLLP